MARRRLSERWENMSPITREMRAAPLTLVDMIERAQTAADEAQSKVNALGYYLKMISPRVRARLPDVEPLLNKLESIYNRLEMFWED